MKKALITGITGQDGSYLAELLLEKGYQVHGIIRRSSSFNTGRIEHLMNDKEIYNNLLFLHYGDVTDSSNINRLLEKTQPDEIYNLAAQSHVKVSFELPEYTAQVDAIGTLRILDAIKESGSQIKFYQASTSELYGGSEGTPFDEKTPFYPRSPYGVAKIYGYWIVVNYREAYNMFACNGILFNHESPRRGETFVSKKITSAAIRIKLGLQDKLYLGNLDSVRDWGYAPEYCEGMYRIMQHDFANDYVLATGRANTVREFATVAFKILGYDIVWAQSKEREYAFDNNTGKVLVNVDPKFYRPSDVEYLKGDASKAKRVLDWEAKTTFENLVEIMIAADYDKYRPKNEGIPVMIDLTDVERKRLIGVHKNS